MVLQFIIKINKNKIKMDNSLLKILKRNLEEEFQKIEAQKKFLRL